MSHNRRQVETDVLIIGAEGAGAKAAIRAREAGLDVIVLSKLYQGRSGSTICAPGDYACDSAALHEMGMEGADPDDSPEQYLQDTLAAGKHLNDPDLARVMCEDAPQRLRELVDIGADFAKAFHYSGHQYPRGAAIGRVGKTGVGLMKALGRHAGKVGAELYEGLFVLDVLVHDGRATGAVALDFGSGETVVFSAKSVVMATGGAARAFQFTSNPEEATGDGMAMALRAGAELVDMEMMQFIPYAQSYPTAMAGNIHFAYELVSLLPSYLVNSEGERFMSRYDPERMEKSTRDYLCIGIASEVALGRGSEHGGAYVQLSHIEPGLLDSFTDEMFPSWRVGAFDLRKFDFDPMENPVEISPASHYSCGGLRINPRCETNLDGFYAAGEVAGGVQGGTRLSGSALTESQVFGAIAGVEAARHASQMDSTPPVPWDQVERSEARLEDLLGASGDADVWAVREEIYEVGQRCVGVLRTEDSLQEGIDRLGDLREQATRGVGLRTTARTFNQELFKALENLNMIDVLEVTARAALRRTESRGSHYRSDFPDAEDRPYHCVVLGGEDAVEVRTEWVRSA